MSTPPPVPQAPARLPLPDPPERPEGVGPTSGRPGWPPIAAPLTIAAALGGAIGVGLIISIVGVIFGADLKHPPASIAIASTIVQDLCFIAAVVFFARLRGPLAPWQLGLRGTSWGAGVGWGALAFAVLVGFSLGWNALNGIDNSEKLPPELGVQGSTAALVATAVLVTILAPIAEELLFRGFVFPALRNWRGTWPAVVITGLLFGLLHVLSAPLYALVPLALFGCLLCLVYLRTRSLYPCIALHALNNCIAFGTAPEVGWDWQIPVLMVGVMATLGVGTVLVRRAFGPAPAGLSPV